VNRAAFDIVIVGAGLAGVVTARELSAAGYEIAVVEARDRPGGRTRTERWHDWPAELGGQWMHWIQPHVWAEIARYGLPLYERPPVERAVWLVDGELRAASFDRFHEIYSPTWARLTAEASEVFPAPYQPLGAGEALAAADGWTVGDRLRRLEPDPDADVICRGICSVMFNAPDQNGAWTQLLRRVALAHHDPELLAEVVATYKLRDGSKALLTAILRDVQADVMLSTAVREIRRRRAGADVTLQDGRVLEARAVVVTAPIHALSRIGFVPALNDAKRSLMAAGQTTQGAMLWLRVAGVDERVLAIAAGDQPISYARWDGELADAALFNAFVPRASALDLGSRVELESALRRLLPAASVLDWRVHDWTADPAAGQTWAMLRPGQLSRLFAGLQEREGTVFFAGADYASGWYGFIDGAIESGLTAARHARLALDG